VDVVAGRSGLGEEMRWFCQPFSSLDGDMREAGLELLKLMDLGELDVLIDYLPGGTFMYGGDDDRRHEWGWDEHVGAWLECK